MTPGSVTFLNIVPYVATFPLRYNYRLQIYLIYSVKHLRGFNNIPYSALCIVFCEPSWSVFADSYKILIIYFLHSNIATDV